MNRGGLGEAHLDYTGPRSWGNFREGICWGFETDIVAKNVCFMIAILVVGGGFGAYRFQIQHIMLRTSGVCRYR